MIRIIDRNDLILFKYIYIKFYFKLFFKYEIFYSIFLENLDIIGQNIHNNINNIFLFAKLKHINY